MMYFVIDLFLTDIRGFMTAHGSPDESRAARIILKDYVNGKLLYCHPPPIEDSMEALANSISPPVINNKGVIDYNMEKAQLPPVTSKEIAKQNRPTFKLSDSRTIPNHSYW